MNYKKLIIASWGPIKTIFIMWIFLITILGFINSIFFDEKGFLNVLYLEHRFAFSITSVIITAILFFFWLIVWNALIKSFFKDEIKNQIKQNSELKTIDE